MDFRAREGSFEEAERRYGELVRQRESGSINEEDFREEQHRIMARDGEGNWWARLGDSGEWYRRDGGEWVPGTPSGYEDKSPDKADGGLIPRAVPEGKDAGRKQRIFPLWIPLVSLAGIALIVVVLIGWVLLPFLYDQQLLSGRGDQAGSQESAGASGGVAFDAVFVQQATPENVSANSTYIDDPLVNGNPDAVVIVTQNWNPGGGSGRYNDHPVGVWYDSGRKKWAIFNQDRAAMPEDAAFNVAIREK